MGTTKDECTGTQWQYNPMPTNEVMCTKEITMVDMLTFMGALEDFDELEKN